MPSTTLRPRLALSVLLVAASITLSGCGATTAPAPTGEVVETAAAAEGYVYEDADAGYAVTFPGEPEIQTAPGDELGGTAVIASYATESAEPTFYLSQAKTDFEVTMTDLPGILINSARASGAVVDDGAISALEFVGLPAFTADVTMSDGTAATVLVAGDVERKVAYQLVVIGDSAETRQAFFDSFELLG